MIDPNPHPLADLPRLERDQVRLDRLLDRDEVTRAIRQALAGPDGSGPTTVGRPAIVRRATGIGRPGVVAQLDWNRLSTRVALGVETSTAHALVDRLLGHRRGLGEARLQVTPVEWGLLAYLAGRTLAALAGRLGPLGPWDLAVDRVGPDPPNLDGLGPIITARWPVEVGTTPGSIRLWLPAALAGRIAEADPPRPDPGSTWSRFGDLAGTWRAEAGTITLPRGLAQLRAGGVAPIDGNPLSGTPANPDGPVVLALVDRDGRSVIDARPAPGGRLVVAGPPRREPIPREALIVPTPEPDNAANPPNPVDLPVTLVVELGRVSLPLHRLADLRAGDVIELGRHAREPVELTSNGRLVARGELVQIDTELGVRVTTVYL